MTEPKRSCKKKSSNDDSPPSIASTSSEPSDSPSIKKARVCADDSNQPLTCGEKSDWSVKQEYTDEELVEMMDSDHDDKDSQMVDTLESESNDKEAEKEAATPPSVGTPRRDDFLDSNPGQKIFSFTGTPGLRKGANTPIEFFRLLANQTFFSYIIDETNVYAEQLKKLEVENKDKEEKGKGKARILAWKPTNQKEFETFLALLYMTGQIVVPEMHQYWKRSKIFDFPAFRRNMSRDRFMLILRALHFGRNPEEGEPIPADPLFKIRPLLKIFNNNMSEIYYPNRSLSLEESLLFYRGQIYSRQNIPNEKCKYGFKIYSLTEPNGLVLRLHIEAGADEKDHAEKVVKELLHDFTGVGHVVFMDSFYNSVPLTRQLLEKNTYVTGQLKKNRIGNSPKIIEAKLKKGEVIQQFTEDGICVMKYDDMFMISSEHDGTKKSVVVKGKTVKRPQILLDYNEGIGALDSFLAFYPVEKKVLSRSTKLGIHIMNVMISNSYILYSRKYGKRLSLLDFRHHVLEAMLCEFAVPDPVFPSRFSLTAVGLRVHLPSKLSRMARKRCFVCFHKNKIRKDTLYFCPRCDNQPGLCLGECFKKHHKYK